VHILGELPFAVTWIDSRAELFPERLPDNVQAVSSPAPINTVGSAPENALFLVMTHDHGLDYALCRRILERGQFTWLGLIGSKSKRVRFRSRLLRDGVAPEWLDRLTCPIGIDGVESKLPAAIAVAVAAQLLGGVGRARAAAETIAVYDAGPPPVDDIGRAPADDIAPPLAQNTRSVPGQAASPLLAADACTSPDCAACSARGGAAGDWHLP
jgi:xanthine/CO dehydrogenase XdhC/CoxF family maturation factor